MIQQLHNIEDSVQLGFVEVFGNEENSTGLLRASIILCILQDRG